jgi:hypothetical protein
VEVGGRPVSSAAVAANLAAVGAANPCYSVNEACKNGTPDKGLGAERHKWSARCVHFVTENGKCTACDYNVVSRTYV